jgi:YVTN family beta-propeller protein
MSLRRIALALSVLLAAGVLVAATSTRRPMWADQTNTAGQTMLPNGWAVTPAGHHIPLKGDMPLAMAFVQGGTRLAVVTGGFHDQGLTLIDVASETTVANQGLGNAWAGLAASGDDLYVSGGPKALRLVHATGDTLNRDADLSVGSKPGWTSGVASYQGVLFVADTNNGVLTRVDGKQSSQIDEPGHPYGVAISADGNTLAVSDWNMARVTLHDPKTLAVTATIPVGSRPNALCFGPNGTLYVACSGANCVSVIRGGSVKETIRTSLAPNDPVGSTPDAVAVSPDGKTVYVANADNNDVAVIDVSGKESAVEGFIPTGWYPSALAVSPDNHKLFIGTGKGLKFEANGFVNAKGKPAFRYIDSLLTGTLSVVPIPDRDQLQAYTAQVMSNAPHPLANRLPSEDQTILKGALKKIHHVVYVIRENRTYDQVFGDMGRGASDAQLTMFGRNVTPNNHALADDFVLLDNTYCNGEVSEDGHQWCNGAYASDFVERSYVNGYSGRGEPDDSDGDADSPAGYLWDSCRKHGKSYRSYGEFASFKSTPDAPPKFDGIKGLEGHASLAWSNFQHGGDYGRDYKKIQVFIDELHEAEKTGQWQDYMVMSLGEDHTSGLAPGKYTPFASVASNDLALGEMVQAISHSRFWKDTAIFIIEDDAQNGPDHVDAHRTQALVVSPYIRRQVLDSTMYSTASFVRTMELILGLPPMTQFDQRATPLFASFTTTPDFTPYDAITEQVDLQAKNPATGELESESKKLDWSHYDAADPDKLNHILWTAIKGSTPMPAPVRSAILAR